ncbi:MAG: tRNA epoxyqueuosine(34) reductase QueG [Chloroflexota bacterium]|jgi:epoxyqueuosine reductase
MSLTDNVKEWAYQAGFDAVGITSTDSLREAEQATLNWINAGMNAGMGWFTEEHARRACRPADLVSNARSVIHLAKCYLPPGSYLSISAEEPQGKFARYAWGEDYHLIFPRMIEELVDMVTGYIGARPNARIFVDSGPLAEKAAAVRAGIGWYGKNSLVITPEHGSWVLLGEIVSDLPLKPGKSLQRDCGECRLCIEHCPTGAIVSPYRVDARRCLSYLTIENRGAIPRDLRRSLGNRIFGCDLCQEVCPHNRQVRPTEDPVFAPLREPGAHPDLKSLMALSGADFKRFFSRSPILRARRKGLLRNVAVALGNAKDISAVPVLAAALMDREALVRSHAAWALGQIGGRRARLALEEAMTRETDGEVQDEIKLALG